MIAESPRPQIPITELNLSDFLLQKIKEYGDGIALTDHTRGKTLTYKELCDLIHKCASVLHSTGVHKGDVIAICSTNRVEFIVVLLATVACGAVASPLNPYHCQGELIELFNISNPRVLFCECELFNHLGKVLSEVTSLQQVFTFGTSEKSNSFANLMQKASCKCFPNLTISTKMDVCLLLYSSGTTGPPKGVMLTNYSVMASLCVMKSEMYMSRSSVYYMFIPMFHSFGYTQMLHAIASGTKMIFDTKFNEEGMFQALQTHRVTHCSAVPPVLNILSCSRFITKYNTSSLQRMMCGGAPTAPLLVQTIRKRFNIILSIGYGLTEISPISISDPVVTKLHSCGTISPNTKIKVINVRTGLEMGPCQKGEILAKAPTMMKGYLNDPEATSATIDKEGWLHTGDLGYYDKDGMLYVEDRLKELIKYKAFQVAPAELETTLLKHPGIADAAVIGIPHILDGEVPRAYVVKKDRNLTEETVKNFINNELIYYKHLRGGVQFVGAIPKSPSGKILRKIVKKWNCSLKSKI